MVTKPCPTCGEQPDVLTVGKLIVTCCMVCSAKKPNGQTGRTVTKSKSAWNAFVDKHEQEHPNA